MSFQHEPTNPRLREIIAALQTLSSNQSQVTDPKKIHLHYARLVKRLLDCEIVILLLIDPEDQQILLRKALLGQDDWSLVDRFQIDLPTLQQVFLNQKIVELQYRSTIFTEFPFLDFLKDQPFLNNILTPIQGQQNFMGIIQAINSRPYPLDPIQMDMLLLISHSFAGA